MIWFAKNIISYIETLSLIFDVQTTETAFFGSITNNTGKFFSHLQINYTRINYYFANVSQI